ncbi:hypothetical protein HYH02_012692 [Chlamydomonas schloesseri]|uniref:Uncharacterized protein n=1 Tax=Chlamydomonas schloesseri TaxID=2026947 RepID=A0A835SU52_9CHLO|nr:hypothetical protein HYH02_012692 [Chlamydomonas schloesseri]|eukprot:KAG2433148.1 hypothetical protein HYH02_012692 [Chlamydomonas schloesseri]
MATVKEEPQSSFYPADDQADETVAAAGNDVAATQHLAAAGGANGSDNANNAAEDDAGQEEQGTSSLAAEPRPKRGPKAASRGPEKRDMTLRPVEAAGDWQPAAGAALLGSDNRSRGGAPMSMVAVLAPPGAAGAARPLRLLPGVTMALDSAKSVRGAAVWQGPSGGGQWIPLEGHLNKSFPENIWLLKLSQRSRAALAAGLDHKWPGWSVLQPVLSSMQQAVYGAEGGDEVTLVILLGQFMRPTTYQSRDISSTMWHRVQLPPPGAAAGQGGAGGAAELVAQPQQAAAAAAAARPSRLAQRALVGAPAVVAATVAAAAPAVVAVAATATATAAPDHVTVVMQRIMVCSHNSTMVAVVEGAVRGAMRAHDGLLKAQEDVLRLHAAAGPSSSTAPAAAVVAEAGGGDSFERTSRIMEGLLGNQALAQQLAQDADVLAGKATYNAAVREIQKLAQQLKEVP